VDRRHAVAASLRGHRDRRQCSRSADDIDRISKKFQSGDVGGGIGDVLGTIGKDITAPLRGVLSTNKDDKRTTSDLIEKGTDTFGKRLDKNYKDTQDNVNPVLKGILGFAGDVALDPTTYIPGAQIAKVGQLIGKGAKAGLDVASAAGKAGADAVKARKASEVVDEAVAAEKARCRERKLGGTPPAP
jgi:hypothetical protein